MVYLFDFDGTLVDSMPFWSGIHIKTLRDAGIPVPDGFVETITPLGNYHAARYTLSLGVDLPFDRYLDHVNSTLFTAYTTHIGLKAHVKDTLERLKARHISLNVLTASPHLYVDPCLQRAGIYELFDNVWTIDDFGLTKAQTEIYQAAAERLHADIADCVMVDENLTAISTAKAAGMQTVAVYDSSSASSAHMLQETADRYIHDFREFPV